MNQFVGKDKYVKDLFNTIAPSYDNMNMVMTWGMLPIWQKLMLKKAELKKGDKAVDICCGTGELAMKQANLVGNNGEVCGLDFSANMLEVGKAKAKERKISNLKFYQGDALELPFADNTFNVATNGYALRNVLDIKKAISEMRRVVVSGGRVVCLEASRPQNKLIRLGFDLYFFKMIPLIGRFVDKGKSIDDKYPAYTWLPESLKNFPNQEQIKQIFIEVGLKDVRYYSLLGGASTIYVGIK